MTALGAAMFLAASVVQAPTAPAAGLYVTSQMEMSGALELQPGGRFRYQLDYGAVSERAEGNWTVDGTTIRLTSNPMPLEPEFALVSDDPAPAGELYVSVEESGIGSWSPLSAELIVEGVGQPFHVRAGDGGRIEQPEGRRILSVKMLVPVYATAGEPVRLSADRGHRLRFRLQPNDLGTAAFRSEPVTVEHSALIMHRYDTEIIFRRIPE